MSMLRIIIIILGVISLSSCAGLKSNNQSNAHALTLKVHVNQNANPSVLRTSSPIAISVYTLTDINAFNQAKYQDIYNSNVNGVEEIGSWVVWPDKPIKQTLNISPSIEYIGIVAHYRQLQGKTWKVVKKIRWYRRSIAINVTQYGI